MLSRGILMLLRLLGKILSFPQIRDGTTTLTLTLFHRQSARLCKLGVS